MKKLIQRLISPNWRPGRAAVAGLVATAAYSVAMEGDMSITGNRFNDVRFIEGLLTSEARPDRRASALAWAIHLLNGVLLAELYAAIFKRFLPGPDWFKGTLFGELFIMAAWGLTPLADRYHPMIQSGELPKLANVTSFWQNVARHLVFGLALGLLYRDK